MPDQTKLHVSFSLQRIKSRVILGGRGAALFGCAFLGGCLTPSEKIVTVRSVVDPAYASRRLGSEPVATERFVIAKGRSLSGGRSDPTGKTFDFPAMAKTLETDLGAAHYERAANTREADVVIVVYWGMTAGIEKPAATLLYDPDALRLAQEAVEDARVKEAADPLGTKDPTARGAVAAAEANLRAETNVAASMLGGNEFQTASAADLLGFADVLRKDDESMVPSRAGETLRSMLDEDRYFVILVGYDAKALRAGQRRRLWITRMSIDTVGMDFPKALERMSGVAAPLHGSPQPGILIQPTAPRH